MPLRLNEQLNERAERENPCEQEKHHLPREGCTSRARTAAVSWPHSLQGRFGGALVHFISFSVM